MDDAEKILSNVLGGLGLGGSKLSGSEISEQDAKLLERARALRYVNELLKAHGKQAAEALGVIEDTHFNDVPIGVLSCAAYLLLYTAVEVLKETAGKTTTLSHVNWIFMSLLENLDG